MAAAPASGAHKEGPSELLSRCGLPLVEASSDAPTAATASSGSAAATASSIGDARSGFAESVFPPDAASPSGRSRTCVERYFGPLTVSGVRHSTLTLCGTALGGGVLSVAFVMNLCGIALGTLLLVIGATLAFMSVSLLMQMCVSTGKQTYAGLFSLCAGPAAGPILDAMLFINGMGSCIGYFVFLGDLIPAIVKLFASWDHEVVRTAAICVSAVMTLPMSLAKDISVLRYVTPVSITSLVFIAAVVSFKAPSLYSDHKSEPSYGTVEVFKLDIHIFEAFALCVFAFNCHMNVIPVAASLVSPSQARIEKVSFRVNVLQFVFYSILGVSGYLSFLGKTQSDILLNYDANDAAVAGGRVLLSGTFIIAVPLYLHPAVRSALQIGDFFAGREAPETRPFAPRAALTFTCTLIQVLVAISVPQVGDVLSLIGGSVSTSIMLLIPAYAVRTLLPRTLRHKIVEALMLFFAVIGAASVPIKALMLFFAVIGAASVPIKVLRLSGVIKD